jgi:predicted lipid-binding transport protein (Tim44 family)
MRRQLGLLLLALILSAATLLARGGGGCLERGTLVDTPAGPVPVEQLRVGDTVWGLVGGQRVRATVQTVYAIEPESYVELVAGGVTLRVTPEHPVQVAPGVFVRADRLRAGATELFAGESPVALATTRLVRATEPAYNLLVSPGGVFFANGFAVHNKGCFLPDTPVTMADGSRRAISAVHEGDAVLAFESDGTIVRTVVREVFTHEVESFLVLRTEQVELRVTDEHPFYVGDGTFKTAETLHAGDTVFAYDGTALVPQRVLALERVQADVTVYNLQTDAPHTFLANGVAVHNKGGGCFAAGTLIATPQGPRAIETLALGDTVLAPAADGSLVPTVVEGVYLNFTPVLTLRTDRGVLRTTAEHPLLDADGGGFRAAEMFAVGARLARLNDSARVLGVERGTTIAPVYTLSVGAPHTFLADGFVVHNKGGGGFSGGGGYHGGGGGGTAPPSLILIIAIVVIVAVCLSRRKELRQADDDELDYCFDRSAIDGKALKTRELLKFISKVDAQWAPKALETMARDVFTKLQSCWSARDYGPMEPLLMHDLYQEHCAQLNGLRETHEINAIDALEITAVDIVDVRYTDKKDQRTFTALISAQARDYYVDDRTQEFLRGDDNPASFQEFWTFQLVEGGFRLREIEQSKESDVLTTENLFEQFTDTGRDQVYGKTAGTSGPAGPSLPTAVQDKDQKIERLLNFLVQTDKIWNRDDMLATARRTYLNILLGWQDGSATAFAGAQLTPALAEQLRTVNESNQRNNWHVEYRNLCVRKAEIVHVDNRDDRTLDRFTARIGAHAQVVISQGGRDVRHDENVRAWVEFWTFARDDRRWVLTEILPDAAGDSIITRENVDQGSSAQMLEWYYSKTRAT